MKTVDVSGMSAGYENACQQMIEAGAKFFKDHGLPSAEEMKEGTSDRMKKYDAAVMKACNNDCTGAMYYTTRSHSYKRVELGEEKYFDVFKDEPGRIYEWDGTVNSIPSNRG